MAGAAKKSIPPPIDKGLAKAYLREFKGWSTAYPPGLSDPTSLRLMENIQITREGGARVRPALRSVMTADVWLDQNFGAQMVGGFEHFFLNDGSKALLFAARNPDGIVGFRVAVYNSSTDRFDVKNLTAAGVGFVVPQGESTLNFSSATTFVRYLQIDNKILALSDGGEDLRLFNVGATKTARKVTPIEEPLWQADRALTIVHPDAAWINAAVKATHPAAETPTKPTDPATGTLISSVAVDNQYNYGFFYTFENEIGESAASQPKMMQARIGWSQWRFFAPDATGNQTTTSVTDPAMAMDQLVASMPQTVFNQALAENAVKWNLYMFTWSDQDAIPMEGILVGSKALSSTATYAKDGWIQCTAAIDLGSVNAVLPTEANRYNYSDPSSASQGLVAGDRLILVNDRSNGALIRWSSNLTGEYTNFTPSKGGGFKTLTSGNLLIPATVKLWQNPQSVDTITILCTGVDGYSTSFYMAPADVSGQTNSRTVMGFEETTATPGTVSPYGVEILNNALYHPLDTELMKSTANNYNINHITMSTDIANKWTELIEKRDIISSQHDNRLYYLVNNPEGETLKPGCKGNEIWVYDGAKDTGTWSRWLVQGIALSKLEVAGRLHVGLARPEGLFVFDENKLTDDASSPSGTVQRAIPWLMETNVQGANRAHDMWARIQQVNVTLGNYRGSIEYGIRTKDRQGHPVELTKVAHHPIDADFSVDKIAREMPFDLGDKLLIERDLMEWYFFARSHTKEGVVQPSYGQVNFVQYMLTPLSVNVGFAEGSLQSFEYGRDAARASSSYTSNGVTVPVADQTRP